MSFPFGSGMPQPQGNNPQQPYPNNPYPQHGAQPPPPHAFGAGYPPPGNAAPFAPYPQQHQQQYGAPPPTFGGAGAPYPPQGHAAPYQQSPQHQHHHQQAYPAGPIGGVPVYPPQHQQLQHAHYNPGYPNQQQPPHGGPHYNAPHGGFNSAYGQQPPPNAYNQHQQQSAAAPQPKGTPTIRPVPNFNAADDAKALRKAMKGFGTDEDALIAVLCHRSNDQIQQIKHTYKTSFGRDLLEDVRSETSGKFETVLCALLLPRLDYYAKELNDAMAGIGTDEDALVEILCSLSNYEIQAIRAHYKQVYYKDLESELMSETSGHFKRLLVSMVTAGRDESGRVDVAEAQQDATALLRAGELRAGTDESTFNMVLCQRNYAQIRAICAEYQRLTGHSLQKAIEKEFSGDICDGLVAVVQCMTNKAEFFATRLHKSMAGLGTTDSQLVRVLVMRAEVDLADVKVAFERLYGKSLRDWIKGDTSGHYKHALYHLIGETPSS